MIFVTVGTTHFDDLVREVDRLVGEGRITDHVVAQVGNGGYEPKHIDSVPYLADLDASVDAADLVVCHGGAGTVFGLLARNKPFIAVLNRSLQDDHQSDMLRAIERAGWGRVCWRVEYLGEAIDAPVERTPYPISHTLASEVWRFATNGHTAAGCADRIRREP